MYCLFDVFSLQLTSNAVVNWFGWRFCFFIALYTPFHWDHTVWSCSGFDNRTAQSNMYQAMDGIPSSRLKALSTHGHSSKHQMRAARELAPKPMHDLTVAEVEPTERRGLLRSEVCCSDDLSLHTGRVLIASIVEFSEEGKR